jgi:hypothetical protein
MSSELANKVGSAELVQELNSLRIKHGTSNVYKTLLTMMRREYEELSELFTCSSNPTITSSDYYNEFMVLNNRAMAETLEEQCYNLHEIDVESIPQEEDVDLDIMDDLEEDIGFYGFGEEGLGEVDVKIISTEDRSNVSRSVDESEDISPKPDIKEIITEPHPAGLRSSSVRDVVKGRGKRLSKNKD